MKMRWSLDQLICQLSVGLDLIFLCLFSLFISAIGAAGLSKSSGISWRTYMIVLVSILNPICIDNIGASLLVVKASNLVHV